MTQLAKAIALLASAVASLAMRFNDQRALELASEARKIAREEAQP